MNIGWTFNVDLCHPHNSSVMGHTVVDFSCYDHCWTLATLETAVVRSDDFKQMTAPPLL